MNDTLDLEQRLRDLAAAAPVPPTPLEQDLERGHRRLRRARLLAGAGAAVGVAAVALAVGLVGTATESGDPVPAGAPTEVASDDPAPSEPSPLRQKEPNGGQLLQTYRDVLAEHLDPDGRHLQEKPDNLQYGSGLGTKLAWTVPGQEGMGMVQIFVGPGWRSDVGGLCGEPGATCSKTTVDGVTATVIEGGGSTTVVVRKGRVPVAITVQELFGNNSLVPVDGLDLDVADLVRAAADERIVPPTPKQIRNAGPSMGFPALPDETGPRGQGVSRAPAPR